MKNKIHQTPDERLALNAESTISAIDKSSQNIAETTKAVRDLHSSVKDKSVEMDGFSAVIKGNQKTNTKLEEIKSSSLIANKHLKDISKKEMPKEMEVTLKGISLVTVKGDKGDKGEKGDKGDRGEKGDSIKGDKGDVGQTGPKGERGEKGDKGESGKNGADGKDGREGRDGSPDNPDEIVEKVNKAKKKISFKQLKDVPEFATADTMNQIGMASGGPTYVWMDDAVRVSDHVREINFGSNLSVSYSNGRLTITGTGGGSGTNVATEKLTPTTSGSDITLDLTGLANTFDTIQWVSKNGQIIDSSDPTFGWSRVTNTITVLNATNTDVFLVHYTYV